MGTHGGNIVAGCYSVRIFTFDSDYPWRLGNVCCEKNVPRRIKRQSVRRASHPHLLQFLLSAKWKYFHGLLPTVRSEHQVLLVRDENASYTGKIRNRMKIFVVVRVDYVHCVIRGMSNVQRP